MQSTHLTAVVYLRLYVLGVRARNEFVHSWDRVARFYANTDLFVYSVEMCHLAAKLLPNPLTVSPDRDKLVSGLRDDKV